jgi:phosphoribosylglycinamide formyltransferase 1
MKIKVALLTGEELRHKYFASFISSYPKIDLKIVVHESNNKLSKNPLYKKYKIVKEHIDLRKKTEHIFFDKYVKKNNKYNFIKVEKSKINEEKLINLIKKKNVDFLISYGCSIVDKTFINHFKPNFFNIHLGLSPYYKGAGTNFFPFVNKQLQFCGSTIMEINEKIDGGKIIHQSRPDFETNDNIHSVGNKIIKRTVEDLCKIISKKKKIRLYKLRSTFKTKTYKQKDFNQKNLKIALDNIKNKLILKYILKNKKKMEKKYSIINQL